MLERRTFPCSARGCTNLTAVPIVALPVGGTDINQRETGLSIGVSLLGKWAQQSRRLRVVALHVGGTRILKRSSGYWAAKARRQARERRRLPGR